MKIEKIEIYGYGKWLQKEFAQLEDMQVFLGNNEAGKSTLSSFVHTMFFGFPSTRKKDFNTYVPKQGESYGGRLFLSGTRFGEVIVERLKDRNRGKATLTYPSGQQEVVDHLASYFLGVDGETYDLLYTFKIDRLLELNKVKKEDLNRYLLGVGTSGSEKILQLADQYQKDAQKEFRPTGTVPPLNKKMKKTEELWQKLQKVKQKNSEYETLLVEANQLQEKMEEGQQQQVSLESENRDLSEAIRLNDYYQEWLMLNQTIEAVDTSVLPKDAKSQWERVQNALTENLQRQATMQQQIKTEQKALEEYTHAKWYRENKPKWNEVHPQFSHISSLFNQTQFLEGQLKQQEVEVFLFRRGNGIEDFAELALLDEKQEEAAKQLLVQEKKVQADWTTARQWVSEYEKTLDSLEIRLRAAQEKLVDAATFSKWQVEAGKPLVEADPAGKKESLPPIIWTVLGILSLLAAVFVPAIRFFAIIAAVGFFAAAVLIRRKPSVPVQATNDFQMDEYIRQATMRERIMEWENETETAQERLLGVLNEQEAYEFQLEAEKEKQQEWLAQIGYPTHFSLERILTDQPAAQLKKLEDKVRMTQSEIQTIDTKLKKWQEDTSFIRNHFSLHHLDGRGFLNRFLEIYNAVILEDTMAQNTEEKLKELQETIQEVQERLNQQQQRRQQLLQAAKVETEAEFYQLLHAKEEQVEQKRRRDFLGEQLKGKEAILSRYIDKLRAMKKLARNEEKLVQLGNQLKEWQKQELALRHEIHLLEEGGTYSTLLQEYAIAETQLREMIVHWGKKVVAAEWLEDTLRYGKENRFPTILEDMNTYFKRLTDDAYSRVVFQNSGLKVQHRNGIVYQPYELSQGTVEQLYIAMRFAFIKNTADIANLPILVDDGFVNFDPNRKQVMYQLLQELSKTVQVFFFTFDQTVVETFSTEQIRLLNGSM